MITINLPYKIENIEDIQTIVEYQKQYSNVLRSVYNRKKEGMSDIDIRSYMKTISYSVNCWLIESAIYEAKAMLQTNKPVIFGSKKQFIRRCKGLISNEDFKKSRLSKFYSIGQANQKGNRFFTLNIIDDNEVIFKPNRNTKIRLKLPNLKPNIKKDLHKLELLAKSCELSYTIKLDSEQIYFMFEEPKSNEIIQNQKERFLSLDLNPNHIGLSITEYINNEFKIIHTQEFDLTDFIKISNHNKIKFETLEISKTIINILKHYKCKYLFLEDLKMVGKNHNKGKSLNKLINNSWFRNLLSNNLQKRCNILGIKTYKINPAYSSYIGNIQHNYSDPINASIEVGRRGYEVIVLRNKDKFYPDLHIKDSLLHQWKEMDIDRYVGSWKELCLYIKNSKLRYRVPMDEAAKHHKVYRQKYNNPRGLSTYIC